MGQWLVIVGLRETSSSNTRQSTYTTRSHETVKRLRCGPEHLVRAGMDSVIAEVTCKTAGGRPLGVRSEKGSSIFGSHLTLNSTMCVIGLGIPCTLQSSELFIP